MTSEKPIRDNGTDGNNGMDGKAFSVSSVISVYSVISFWLGGKRLSRTVVLFTTLLIVFSSNVTSSNELTPQEKRGQQIYLRGTSPSGQEITAVLGGGTTVPASAMPCANCHGSDGLGRAEGGVIPSNITWEALTKPYGAETNGRRHDGFSFGNALRQLPWSRRAWPRGGRCHSVKHHLGSSDQTL